MERLPFDVAGIVASFLVPTELRSESLAEDAEDPFENVSSRRTVASDDERDLPAERWAGADAEVLGSLRCASRAAALQWGRATLMFMECGLEAERGAR
jgi:hypothetical protein